MGETFFSKVLGSPFLLETILLLEVYIKEKETVGLKRYLNALAAKHEDWISET